MFRDRDVIPAPITSTGATSLTSALGAMTLVSAFLKMGAVRVMRQRDRVVTVPEKPGQVRKERQEEGKEDGC